MTTTMAIDKIKRSLVWMRKTLGIIEKTTLPGEIVGEVRPTIDTLGWDRLLQLEPTRVNAAAPAQVVISAAVPSGIVRYIHTLSISHTDANVEHEVSVVKRRQPNTFNIGQATDRRLIGENQFCSIIHPIMLVEGEFVIGQVLAAPVVGVLILTFLSVDIEQGEYISAM